MICTDQIEDEEDSLDEDSLDEDSLDEESFDEADADGPVGKTAKTTKKAATAADSSNAWGCGRNNDQPKTCCYNPHDPTKTVWAQCGNCGRSNTEVPCGEETVDPADPSYD